MNQITYQTRYGNDADWDDLDEWKKRSNPWTVELRYQGRTMEVEFWTGQAIKTDPTARDVCECIFSDAAHVENTSGFEDWASELGFNPDSRAAEKIYRKSLEQTERLKEFLGDGWPELIYSDESEMVELCADSEDD